MRLDGSTFLTHSLTSGTPDPWGRMFRLLVLSAGYAVPLAEKCGQKRHEVTRWKHSSPWQKLRVGEASAVGAVYDRASFLESMKCGRSQTGPYSRRSALSTFAIG